MAKILLVEDDSTAVEIYVNKFEAAGFEVAIVPTSEEALKLVSQQQFDLVLLEGGVELLKELKQKGSHGIDLKVLVLGGPDKTEHEKEVKENGGDGFLLKTQYNPTELVNEVQRFLNEAEEQKKNKERLSAGDGGIACDGKRILFIEDEEIFLEMFGKKLENEGYCLEYAKNGAWGSKLAAEKEYDLIITDMVMPAMSGEEIIRRIKLDDKTKNIPIIVLSASLAEEDIQPVRELGISEFHEKTRIVPSDLARRVKELLND